MTPTERVSGDSFRQVVLAAAKRFKATWFELGKLLVTVRDDAQFQDWGYETFEAYCWKELRIRKQTAWKLTRSFAFLSKYEPKIAPTDAGTDPTPPLELVEVLARADERGQISAEEYRSVRDSIWENEKSMPEIRRELLQRFPKPEVPVTYTSQLRRFAHSARKLAGDLRGNRRVPRAIVDRAAALAEDLDELAAEAEAA